MAKAERAHAARVRQSVAAAAMVMGAIVLLHGASNGKDGKKRESGIYVESAETSGKDEMKQLEGSMPQMQAEGVGASMATMGFKRPKMVTKVGGDKSAVRVTPQSTFLFVFGGPKSQREMMENPMGSMSALPQQTSSPKDYALVILALVDGDRVYNSGNGKQIKCAVENVEPKVFRIKPEAPLAPGEYAFAWMNAGAASMMWDFGVDGATK
jgi:hypothetical protein